MAIHEELLPRVATLFSTVVQTQDITNATSRDEYASATTVATFQSVNNTKEALAHEADKAIYRICNRAIDQANQMGIYTDTEITAANSDVSSTYYVSSGFQDNDSTLPVKFHGGRF